MTTFSYTTGNPSNLTAGATASMNDIQGPFTDVRTFLNGANLDATNIASGYVEPAFSTYKTALERGAFTAAATVDTGASIYLLAGSGTQALKATTGSGSIGAMFYFDPADWTAGSRSTKLRLRSACVVGATGPGQSITVGLYPGTANSGSVSVGTVVSGSTVALGSQATNAMVQGATSDFTPPTAGWYAIGFATSGAWTASSTVAITGWLQVRQV